MKTKRIFFSLNKLPKRFNIKTHSSLTFQNDFSSSNASNERFKNLNSMYQDYRNKNKFELHKPYEKSSYFITETQRAQQKKELTTIFKDFSKNYHDLDIFNEEMFMNLLKIISITYENSFMLEDPKFLNMIQKNVDNLNKFTNYNNVVLLMSFCNYHKIENNEIWSTFKSYIFNNYKDFKYPTKVLTLCSFNESKYKDDFDILFDLFEIGFEDEIRNEKLFFINVYQLQQIYRRFDKGSENFYETIQLFYQKQMEEMNIDNLLILLVYYSESTKENIKTISSILSFLEKRFLQLLIFLTPQELITSLYCFIRSNKGSQKLLDELEKRCILTLDKFTIKEIDKLLIISTMRDVNKAKIFKLCEEIILKDIKLVKHNFLPSIFISFCENGVGSETFYNVISNILTNSIFLYDADQISKLVWAYSIKKYDSDIFYKKAEEFIKLNISNFSPKNIALLVWSLTEVQKGTTDLFVKFESEIETKIESMNIKDIAQILWGYTNKMRLRKAVIDKILDKINEKEIELMDIWDLTTILWAFSRLAGKWDKLKLLETKAFEMLGEMNKLELLSTFKSFYELEWLTTQSCDVFAEKLGFFKNNLSENEIIVILHIVSRVNEVMGDKMKSLIVFLWQRLKELEQKRLSGKSKEDEIKAILNDPEYYLQHKKNEN